MACDDYSAPEVPADALTKDLIKGTLNIPSDSLAITIVNELNENLVDKTELKSEQAETIAIKAVGALEIQKLGLIAAEGFEDRIEDFAGILVAGAIDGLDEIGATHQRQLNRVLEVVIESVVASLYGRTGHLENDALGILLLSISELSIKNLQTAGFSIQSTAEGARAIVASAIGALDDAGILTEVNGRAVVAAIVKGSVRGLKESPLAQSTNRVIDFGTVLDDVMYGAVGSLDDAGFALTEIDRAMQDVCRAGISELDSLGFGAADYEYLIEALMEGALDGLQREAGVTDDAEIETAIGYCVLGATEGLKDSNLPLAELDEIIAHVVEKSIAHLDNLGITKANTETAVEHILSKAMNGLIMAGFSKDRHEEFADVCADMTLAAIEGLTEVGFKNDEVLAYFDDMLTAIYLPLKEHSFTKAEASAMSEHYKTLFGANLAASTVADLVIAPSDLAVHVQTALDAAFGP